MEPRDAILAVLEVKQLVPHALLDENASRMLGDDRLFVLQVDREFVFTRQSWIMWKLSSPK